MCTRTGILCGLASILVPIYTSVDMAHIHPNVSCSSIHWDRYLVTRLVVAIMFRSRRLTTSDHVSVLQRHALVAARSGKLTNSCQYKRQRERRCGKDLPTTCSANTFVHDEGNFFRSPRFCGDFLYLVFVFCLAHMAMVFISIQYSRFSRGGKV